MTWVSDFEPTCPPAHRPAALLANASFAGLRAAQVHLVAGTREIRMWLFHPPDPSLAHTAAWKITAPRGAPSVAIVEPPVIVTDPVAGDHVVLTIAGEPANARYRVEVVLPLPGPDWDPLRTWLLVGMRPECDDLGGCDTPTGLAVPRAPLPEIDYTARDWVSLRAALLEHLVALDPDADLSVADPTVTLAELFAHAGDLLHYRLDRVATEAFLETARLRTSLRRHARLVDFLVRDGVSATTVVHLSVAPTSAMADRSFTASSGDLASVAAGSTTAFTLTPDGGTLVAHASLSEIAIHDWDEDACCLPAGATSCAVVRPQPADALAQTDNWLQAGQQIVFEVIDPEDDAKHLLWSHRDPRQPWPPGSDATFPFRTALPSRTAHVVRLRSVTPITDPLAPNNPPLFRLSWGPEDALARSYPVGIDRRFGASEVTIVRANLSPAHHSRRASSTEAVPQVLATDVDATSAWSLTGAGAWAHGGPGLSRKPTGEPWKVLAALTLPSRSVSAGTWVPSLLDGSDDPALLAYVVDTEVHTPPVLRFRSGALGVRPPDGSWLDAVYEVGAGLAGNLPASSLQVFERLAPSAGAPAPPPSGYSTVGGVVARNVVPATGGLDPDDLDGVRRDAPEAFVAVPKRAVTTDDYARTAERDPQVQRAFARREWSGSWPLVTVVVDLLADPESEAGAIALASLSRALDDVRMVGTEVAVVPGTPVPFFLALRVCILPGFDVEAARQRILALLRPGSDAAPGFFHSSKLRLGTSVYTSAVLAVAAGVPGVDAVELTAARRVVEPKGTVHQVLTFASTEMPVLDDDPDRPDRGRLSVTVQGGR